MRGLTLMATRRVLRDNVTIYNYAGEAYNEAVYFVTYLSRVNCSENNSTNFDSHGEKRGNNAKLYFFETYSLATDYDGNKKLYLPYDEWLLLDDKSQYWTICTEGNDYFVVGITDESEPPLIDKAYKISGFSNKRKGTRRMWHMEVDGK